MVSPRIRDVADKKEMDRVMDDFFTQGYTTKEQGTNTVLLKKKTWGSIAGLLVTWIVGLLFSIFTVGISLIIPIAYMAIMHFNAPEVLLRIAQK